MRNRYRAARPHSFPTGGLLFALLAGSCSSRELTTQPPVRLLDRTLQPISGNAVSAKTGYISGLRRFAVRGGAPHAYSYRFEVPAGGKLRLSLGRYGDLSGSVPITIEARGAKSSSVLLEKELAPDLKEWDELVLDLGAFGGQEIDLVFTSLAAVDGSEVSEDPVGVLWSELFVESGAFGHPNIVLLMIDTLNADHLGCYGYDRETSPTIDSLASDGVRFDNAISAAPWTDPSILALFTGLYPSDVWSPADHAETIRKTLPPEATTLAGTLAKSGYYTIAASDHPGIAAKRFGRGFDIYCHLFADDGPYTGWRQTPTQRVLKQLKELIQNCPAEGVFLYVHLIYPHRPYDPPSEYRTMFGPPAKQVRHSEREGVINLYDAEIRRTDDLIAAFMDDLDEANFDEDMILALVSDHGEGFWEHGLSEHGNSLFNELLHIPFILRAPGRLPAGKTVHQLVSHVDLFPTLLELADIPSPGVTRGESLVSVARNGVENQRLLLSEFPHSDMIPARALQSHREKLIHPGPGQDLTKIHYFNMLDDPAELRDLSSETESKQRIVALTGLFPKGKDRTDAGKGSFEPSTEMIDSLKALGYMSEPEN